MHNTCIICCTENQDDEEQGHHQKPGEGQAVPASNKTLVSLLVSSICVGDHYAQTNTNNVNKILALLQTTGG